MNKQDNKIAKQLLELSLANGQVSDEKVLAIVSYIKEHYQAYALPILKAYQKAVMRYQKEHTIIIETASPLSEQQEKALVRKVTDNTTRYRIESKLNPHLIGGVKVYYGDSIYEDSIANNFAQIKEGI
jgi:F0F1-type ATP synthase delta subunit